MIEEIEQNYATVKEIVAKLKQGEIVNQLPSLWSNDQKSALIQALILRTIDLVIFTELKADGTHAVFIGNDELSAIKEFTNDEFKINWRNGQKFSEIYPIFRELLMTREIETRTIHEKDSSAIPDIIWVNNLPQFRVNVIRVLDNSEMEF
ncbi:MAG: hypothetical protein WAZ19_07455 [Anaerolineae bacterium]